MMDLNQSFHQDSFQFVVNGLSDSPRWLYSNSNSNCTVGNNK